MTFISKHYDKALLVLLLVMFIGVLFYLVFGMGTNKHGPILAQEVAFIDLYADGNQGAKVRLDPSIFADTKVVWLETRVEKNETPWASDLFLTPTKNDVNRQILRCTECKALIPYADYQNKQCSWCGAAIKPAVIRSDIDGDGIPDDIEEQIGTNKEVADSDEDVDGDSFTNFEEYLYVMNMPGEKDFKIIADAKRHPPMHVYLSVDRITQGKLNFALKTVIPLGKKKQVNYTYTSSRNGRTMSANADVGDTVTIGGEKFIFVDANQDQGKNNPAFVRLKEVQSGAEITAVRGEKNIKHPQKKVTLVFNFGEGKKFEQLTDSTIFSIGNEKVGYESYKVLSVSEADKKECRIISVDAQGKEQGEAIVVTQEQQRDVVKDRGVVHPEYKTKVAPKKEGQVRP